MDKFIYKLLDREDFKSYLPAELDFLELKTRNCIQIPGRLNHRAKRFFKMTKIYGILFSIFYFIPFIMCAILGTFFEDECFVLICILATVIVVSVVTLILFCIKRDKIMNKYVKDEFVCSSLNQIMTLEYYHSNAVKIKILKDKLNKEEFNAALTRKENSWSFQEKNKIKKFDLLTADVDEKLQSVLNIGGNECSAGYFKHDIKGSFHGVSFRYLEARMTHKEPIIEGLPFMYNEALFSGMIYIFALPTNVPFDYQYEYLDKPCKSVWEFETSFKSYAYDRRQSFTNSGVQKRSFSNREGEEQFEIDEATRAEFRSIIESLDFVKALCRLSNLLNEHDKWIVRLSENRLILIIDRNMKNKNNNDCGYNYCDNFNYNYHNDYNHPDCRDPDYAYLLMIYQFEKKIDEFSDILETMTSIDLLSEGKNGQ